MRGLPYSSTVDYRQTQLDTYERTNDIKMHTVAAVNDRKMHSIAFALGRAEHAELRAIGFCNHQNKLAILPKYLQINISKPSRCPNSIPRQVFLIKFSRGIPISTFKAMQGYFYAYFSDFFHSVFISTYI